MFALWSLRYAIFLHQSSLEVYYKVTLCVGICVNISCSCATPGAIVQLQLQLQLQLGSKTLCHACMLQIGVQVLSALNPVDPLHNCMFE